MEGYGNLFVSHWHARTARDNTPPDRRNVFAMVLVTCSSCRLNTYTRYTCAMWTTATANGLALIVRENVISIIYYYNALVHLEFFVDGVDRG